MGKIRTNNPKFFTRNGALAEEKRLEQQVETNPEMQLSLTETGRIDGVTQIVNYAEVNELIAQRVNNRSYDLIKGLAGAILGDISAGYQEQLSRIIIKVRKYSVSMPGLFDNIEVEMEREVQMIGYVALGSNIGDPYANLVRARNYLNENPQIQIVTSSKLCETGPYGYTDQDDFLNAVLKIDTSYTARKSLAIAQGIEQVMKRKELIHWGLRIIDIDTLLLREQSVALSHLQVPHQGLTEQSFVLISLSDVYVEE